MLPGPSGFWFPTTEMGHGRLKLKRNGREERWGARSINGGLGSPQVKARVQEQGMFFQNRKDIWILGRDGVGGRERGRYREREGEEGGGLVEGEGEEGEGVEEKGFFRMWHLPQPS